MHQGNSREQSKMKGKSCYKIADVTETKKKYFNPKHNNNILSIQHCSCIDYREVQ